MKNIKQLAALTALLIFANPAKAEEKDFTPMGQAEDIKSIQLVNGQILVKPDDKKVPYYMVSTNTDNFAEKAFAHKNMKNFKSFFVGSKSFLGTKNGKLLQYPFTQNALNNVPTKQQTLVQGVEQIISVNGDDVVVANTNGTLATYHIAGNKATTNSVASTSYQNGTNIYEAVRADNTIPGKMTVKILDRSKKSYQNCFTFSGLDASQPKSLIAFKGSKELFYLLTEDGNVYTNNNNGYETGHNYIDPIMEGISSLAATADGTGFIVSKRDAEGKLSSVKAYKANPEGMFVEDQELLKPVVASKEFTANGIRYYAVGKKLGFERN